MPKFVVGIISATFALAIGFACGALLTVPKNTRMEKLVNDKAVVEKNVAEIEQQNKSLQKNVTQLERKNQDLEKKLLNAFQAQDQARKKLLEAYREK